MTTAAKTVNALDKSIRNAFETAISKGLLPQAEIPAFNLETPADRSHHSAP